MDSDRKVMDEDRKVETYVPNRRFKEIVKEHWDIVNAISGLGNLSGKLIERKWKGVVGTNSGDVGIVVMQKYGYTGTVVDANVEVSYFGVSRKDLAPIRRVLCASGLKRIIEKKDKAK